MPLGTFLNGGTATQLRGLQWLALSDTGQIGAGTVTGDSGGGGVTVWTYTGAVPCRVDPVADRGAGAITGGRIDERSTHVITTPAGVSVSAENRFAVLGRGTFEVTATRTRTDGWTQVFEVVEAS